MSGRLTRRQLAVTAAVAKNEKLYWMVQDAAARGATSFDFERRDGKLVVTAYMGKGKR